MPAATDLSKTASPDTTRPARWLTPGRICLYAGTLLVLECVVIAAWWYSHTILANPTVPGMGWDFVVYWCASGLAQLHGAPAAYDWELLRLAERPLLPTTFGPFAYPPTFLLLIYPLALVPFGLALVLFSLAGIAAYLGHMRTVVGQLHRYWFLPALAFPGLWVALIAGQNSLFTAVAAGCALWWLRRHPVAAGACIALLCVKPQLGVLFPLMLLCERRWVAFAAAAGCSVLFAGLTTLVFGLDIYPAFFRSMAMFRDAVAVNSSILRGAPTIFGMLRVAGADVPLAYALHGAVAMCAVGACVWIWCGGARLALGASALVIGTLLVQPYLIYYDLAWLAIPLALLCVDMVRHGSRAWERLLLVVAWLVPAQAVSPLVIDGMPQFTPFVLAGLLAMIVARHQNKTARP
ncbi:glycosyltransferase family 87 protein [Cupriavidus sp. D384]|uniref:glycosyltransferase family 87 protein n=1 Tax=Cupriavidus sp. D384 TaxID=1538095 RepID=UPI0008299952|nr:glycosyltransferase family 87 protein [Cupriavidus sp. D384]